MLRTKDSIVVRQTGDLSRGAEARSIMPRPLRGIRHRIPGGGLRVHAEHEGADGVRYGDHGATRTPHIAQRSGTREASLREEIP